MNYRNYFFIILDLLVVGNYISYHRNFKLNQLYLSTRYSMKIICLRIYESNDQLFPLIYNN